VRTENAQNPSVAKWVHVSCAKWQGLNYLDPENPECVESVHELKSFFLSKGIFCLLCKGTKGAYHKCAVKRCQRYMHLSCARSLGTCSVIHGKTTEGKLDAPNAWTLKCPKHSNVKVHSIPKRSLSIEQLVEAARHFPPDPLASRLIVKERCKLTLEKANKPPPYSHIKSLRYDKVLRPKPKAPSGESCQCYRDQKSTSCDESCINRIMGEECVGSMMSTKNEEKYWNCDIGVECGNRMISRNQSARVAVKRQADMGFGLYALDVVKCGKAIVSNSFLDWCFFHVKCVILIRFFFTIVQYFRMPCTRVCG